MIAALPKTILMIYILKVEERFKVKPQKQLDKLFDNGD